MVILKVEGITDDQVIWRYNLHCRSCYANGGFVYKRHLVRQMSPKIIAKIRLIKSILYLYCVYEIKNIH